MRTRERYERYQRAVEMPLLAVALLLIPLLTVPLVVDLPSAARQAVAVADIAIWAVFAADYVIGLALAPSRRAYVRKEWLNLALVALPMLRPVRLLRSARVLRALRLARLASALSVGTRGARRLLVRHQLHYAILASVVLAASGGIAMYVAESGSGGPIRTLPDGLWWAMSTMTTVGYGDLYPATGAGRAIALVLMVAGIAFFGIVTANLATFLMERSVGQAESHEAADAAAILTRLDEIARRLDALETQDHER